MTRVTGAYGASGNRVDSCRVHEEVEAILIPLHETNASSSWITRVTPGASLLVRPTKGCAQLCFARVGPAHIELSGDRVALGEGDALVLLEGAPAVVRGARDSEVLVFRLPSAPFEDIQGLRRNSVVLETRSPSTLSILGHLLRALGDEHSNDRSVGDKGFPQQLAALVRLHCRAVDQSGDGDLWTRSEQAIESALWDPELDPAYVAGAVHVSVRTLHRVFRARGTSLSAWIRHRRLEHCREDLDDVSMAQVSVRAIGARWGLHDPAHLSRIFKNAYGRSPSAYRKATAKRHDGGRHGTSAAARHSAANRLAAIDNE
jgi:AraC-like DNA-binding protein